jgi:hypothetical protein
MSSVEGSEELPISLEQSQTGGIVVPLCAGPPRALIRISSAFSRLSGRRSLAGSGGPCDLPVDHSGCGQMRMNLEVLYCHSASQRENELMNSPQSTRQTEGPHEDTVLDASHRLACEGSK